MRKLWPAICAANLFVAPWPRNVLADIALLRFERAIDSGWWHGIILPIEPPRFFDICIGRPIPLPGMAERDEELMESDRYFR